MLDSTFTEHADRFGGFVSRRIANAKHSREVPANGKVNHGCGSGEFVNLFLFRLAHCNLLVFDNEMLAADNGAFTVESRRDSMRDNVLDIGMFFFVVDSPFGGPAHNGTRHAMREVLFDAGRDAEDFFFAAVSERNHAFEFRFRLGERSRLVENDGVCKREFFQVLAALHGHVAVSRFAQRRNHRNRGGKFDGARIVHHQNRDRLGDVARKQEREPESDKAERHNSVGKAFGAALDRSLQVFGAIDEFDNFLNLGVGTYSPHRYYDGAFVYDGARKNGLTDRLMNRLRFARHSRFVHKGVAFGNGSIHRNHAAGTHTHKVAHLNILHAHLNIDAIANDPHLVHLHGKACSKGCAGTCLSIIFQEATYVQQEHNGSRRFVIALQDARSDSGSI